MRQVACSMAIPNAKRWANPAAVFLLTFCWHNFQLRVGWSLRWSLFLTAGCILYHFCGLFVVEKVEMIFLSYQYFVERLSRSFVNREMASVPNCFCMLWESEVHDARGHGTILRLGNYLRICVNVGKWWDGYGWLGKSSQAEMVGISNSFADSYRRKPLFMTLDVMIVNEKNEGAWCMDVHAYSFKILTHLKTNMLLMEEIRHHTGCIKP